MRDMISKLYKDIEVEFLGEMLGDNWLQVFNSGWENENDFLAEYSLEYKEYIENWEDMKCNYNNQFLNC